MSKFNSLYSASQETQATQVLHAVRSMLSGVNRNDLSGAGRTAFARENVQEADLSSLANVAKDLQGSIRRAMQPLESLTGVIGDKQLKLATEAAILATNVREHLARPVVTQSDNPAFAGIAAMADAHGQRMQAAREAYLESDNSSVLENTLTYNLLAGRQNPAGELFFPTTPVPSDNMGVSATIRVYQVHEDAKHSITGAVTNFKRRNLIDGLIDSSILRNDGTLAVPVYRTENAAKFAAGVTAATKTYEGQDILTAPLAFSTDLNLVAMSMTAAMLASGVPDRTDGLDTDVQLSKVYLKVGSDIIGIRTDVTAGNNFIYVGQDNYRVQKLSLRTQTLYIDKNSKTFADATLSNADLATITSDNLVVRLGGSFTGEVNIETGALVVDAAGGVKVLSIIDADTKTNITTTSGAALKTAIEAGTWYGFDIQARRANANLRERGQLVDTQYYTQIWAVPLRSPVTALRPVNTNGAQDGDDLEKLAATTFIRTSGAAVKTLLDTIGQLRSLRGLAIEPGVQPETLGVGRHLLNSLLIEEEVDAALNVASLTSSELSDDISAMLVNRITEVAYRLFRDSKFQAVVESGAAGTTELPTIIAMTDPMTARYLMVKGDVRTAGPDFQLKVETTPNKEIENKIVIAFGYPGKSDGALNTLHYGAMLWSPELALVLPISRNGQTSKELTVQPRFRHIVNVPVMGLITVKNLYQVVQARVPVDFNQI